MTWNPQIDAIFSHVVSQWVYRWMPLPHFDDAAMPRLSLDVLSFSDFTNYLADRWDPLFPRWPWMEFLELKQLSRTALANLVYEQVQKVSEHGASLLDYYHPAYPSLLRCIADPPNALTVRGPLELLRRPTVGIVGSRHASVFALEQTKELARCLAQKGYVIVSGGALGCDLAGHLGALASGITPVPTLAIFAGGLAQLYPRCNQPFFDRILEGGAGFVTERLWDYPARPFDFPVRNRIISGLAERILVMQAAERSGARLTASAALDQGREVFVLVHPVDDVRALGSQQLLEDGALPFYSADDYLGLPVSF